LQAEDDERMVMNKDTDRFKREKRETDEARTDPNRVPGEGIHMTMSRCERKWADKDGHGTARSNGKNRASIYAYMHRS
jgi:hypothetical protein